MVSQLRLVSSSVTESVSAPMERLIFPNANVAIRRNAKVASRNVLARRNGNRGVLVMANAVQDTGSASDTILALLTHLAIRLHPNQKLKTVAKKRFAKQASGPSGPNATRRNATHTVKYSVNDRVNVPKALRKMTRSAAVAARRNVSLARVLPVRVWATGPNGDRAMARVVAESRPASGTIPAFRTLSQKKKRWNARKYVSSVINNATNSLLKYFANQILSLNSNSKFN